MILASKNYAQECKISQGNINDTTSTVKGNVARFADSSLI